ncbi:MAG: hypothetical protein ABIF40_02970 [archaeon]
MVEQTQQLTVDQLLTELNNRVRILESKQTLFTERMLNINQNMIEQYKQITKEIKANREEIKDGKKDIFELQNVIQHLTEEASEFAKRDSVKVLEKYINLWNPLNFVTEEEVKQIVQEQLKGIKDGGKTSTNSRSSQPKTKRS